MKKFARIAVSVLVLALTLIGAVPTQASNLNDAQYMRSLTITNSGAETTNNVVTFDPSTLEMITNGLINSSLTGSAITDLANKDLIYMPKEPVRYKLVKYLECDGTQYIDTGYVPNANTKWVLDWSLTSLNNSVVNVNGCEQSATSKFDIYVTTGNMFVNISGSTSMNFGTASTNRTTAIIDNKRQQSSANSTTNTFTYSNAPSYSIYIGACNSLGTTRYYVSGRIYDSQIYENGVLVRDFVPVQRTTDDVLGLLDRVNNVFYTNKGTGTFGTEQYTTTYYVCDYAESNGTQYINTGYKNDTNFTEIYRFMPTSNQTNTVFCGVRDGTVLYSVLYTSQNIFQFYNNSSVNLGTLSTTTPYTISFELTNLTTNYIDCNGSVYSLTKSASNVSTMTEYIFWANGGASYNKAKMRLYHFSRLSSTKNLTCNLIPVYNAVAQKVQFINTYNGVVLSNLGTGEFDYKLSGNDGTWCLYLPTVAANTSLSERLYISTENLNSKIAYFPGTSGLVVNRNTSNTVTGSDDWNFTIKGHSISGDGSYLFKYGDDLYATLNGNTITFAYGTITIPTSAVNHNTLWGYYYGTVASGVSFTTSSGSITYNSNNMYKSIGGSTNYAPIRTMLTSNPYNQMIVKASGDYSLRIGYATTNTYDPSSYVTGTNNALTVYSLPTGGTVYPLVTDYKSFSSSQSHAVAAYMIAFTKPDNPAQYGTLTKYGANATAMINNSINMLKDAAAVITLATKCTGDFMWACVQSSTFTNALNNSPYKDIITSSVDWAKALAWNSGSYSTTNPNSATVSLSTTQTVPVGYHTYDFRKEGNSISIYVDSNLVRGGIFNETSYYTAITALGYTYSQVASYDTDAQIVFAQGGTTLYADQIQQKKNSNNVGQWSWAQTDTFTFPDTSGNGNTGYPSFRETNYGSVANGANLSVSFGVYQPSNVAEYNPPGGSQSSTFTGLLPPVEQPTQTVDLGNIKNVPFAEVFEDLLGAGGIPSQLFWLPIMMTLAIAACGVAYHLTRDALISCIAGDIMLGLGCALSLLYTVPLVIGIITTIVLLVKRKTISL